jgi:hypothetical protein
MSLAALTEAPRPAPLAAPACAHCGEPLRGAAARFCCGGCAAAFHLVGELGLERYYAGRRLDPDRVYV